MFWRCATLAACLALNSAVSHTQSDAVVELLGNLQFPGFILTDLAVEQGYAYLGAAAFDRSSFRLSDGRVYIVDARNPESGLRLEAVYTPSLTPAPAVIDVQIQGNLLFAALKSGGLAIVDVSDRSNPKELRIHPELGGVHNVFVSGHYAYLARDGARGLVILDITDPSQPRAVAVYRPQKDQRPHDMTVVGNLLYLANIIGNPAGFEFLDVADPANPQLRARYSYDGAVTHNIWPSPDGRYVATTDEICPGGNLKIWDIRDFENIRLAGEYRAVEQVQADTSVHNAKWVGNLIFMSNYKLGLRVVDVLDPSQPREIARFGTASAEELGDSFCLFGAWGVDAEPAADGARIYISDIRNGLWVFRLSVARRQRLVRR